MKSSAAVGEIVERFGSESDITSVNSLVSKF
jgi:hypothetical protein